MSGLAALTALNDIPRGIEEKPVLPTETRRLQGLRTITVQPNNRSRESGVAAIPVAKGPWRGRQREPKIEQTIHQPAAQAFPTRFRS